MKNYEQMKESEFIEEKKVADEQIYDPFLYPLEKMKQSKIGK